MLYADTENGKTRATPGAKGKCPLCGSDTIAKCGRIIIWHWAHRSKAACDAWGEESDWHREWKGHAPPECCEVTMSPHRADVRMPDGTVIEFQKSSISVADIISRERFYGKMIWVFDAQDWGLRYYTNRKKDRGFIWNYARKSLEHCLKPIFFDVGNGKMLKIEQLHFLAYRGGWYSPIMKQDFIREQMTPAPAQEPAP